MKNLLKPIAALAVTTIIFGTIYVVGQQILRMNANDPQIQMAEDAAATLDHGASPGSLVSGKVDVSSSLAPFIIIYNKEGNAVASPAYTGDTPLIDIPVGVLKNVKNDYYAVTWRPETNVRLAAVAVSAHDYYVVGARSLKEVEKRENTLMDLAGFGWVLSVLVVGTAYLLSEKSR